MSIEEKVALIKEKGFKIVGYCEFWFEDTFIFKTEKEAFRAYDALGSTVKGSWMPKRLFLEEKPKFDSGFRTETIVTWL